MPEARTIEKARRAKAAGKAPSTQAGAFVQEEIEHVREGKHGARSTKQAIAIGLSKARRAGVRLPPPKAATVSEKTRKQAARESERAKAPPHAPSRRRSKATLQALRREGHSAGSKAALSRQTHAAAKRRTARDRSAAAARAARTKGPAVARRAAKKASRTRAASSGSR